MDLHPVAIFACFVQQAVHHRPDLPVHDLLEAGIENSAIFFVFVQ
jgi:hypothetical protein